VTVTTGTNGQYALTGLRSGTYTVVLATTANCTTAATTQTVTIAAGEARVVNFTCTQAPPPPTVEPATVSIESITAGPLGVGGTVLDNAVAGIVTVNVAVNEGGQRVNRVELLLGGQVVGTQTRTVAAPEQGQELADFMVSFVVNTAEFNATTGVPRFLNTVAAPANNNFTARIFTVAGGATTAAATAVRTIALTNADAASIVVTPQSTVLGGTGQGNPNLSAAGLTWWYGNLTINALPVFYSGHTATNVTITVNAMSPNGCVTSTTVDRTNYRTGACQTAETVSRVLTAAPYSSVLLAANSITSGNNATSTDRGVGNIEDVAVAAGGGLNIVISSIRNDGQPSFVPLNFSTVCDDGRVPNPAPPLCASGQAPQPIRYDTSAPLIDQVNQVSRWSESYAWVPPPAVESGQGVTRWLHDLAFEMTTSNNTTSQVRATDRGTGTTGTFYTFEFGTDVAAMTAQTSATALAETLNQNVYFARANARDIAGNSRGRFNNGTTAGLASPLSTANQTALLADADAKLGADHHAPFLGLNALTLDANGEVIGGGLAIYSDGVAAVATYIDCHGVVDPITQVCTIDTFTSNPSGFPPNPVKTRIRRYFPDVPAAARCWVGNYGGNNPTCRTLGTQSNQSGTNGSFDFTVGSYSAINPLTGVVTNYTLAGDGATLLNTNPVGYYRLEMQAVDAAGGNSVLKDVTFVRDFTAPVVGGVLFPAILTPGAQVTVQAGVADDLDLDKGEFFLVANTDLDAFRQSVTTIGTFGFGDETIGPAGYTQQANLSTTIPFVHSLQEGTANAPAATTHGSFRVRDFGHNNAFAYSSPFPPPIVALRNYSAGVASVAITMNSENLTSTFNVLCWDTDTNGCPTNPNTSAVVSFTVSGAGSSVVGGPLQIPFTRVDFLVAIDENNDGTPDLSTGAVPNNVLWTTLGPAGVAVTENVGATVRTYNWSRTVTAAELASASGRTTITAAAPIDPLNNVRIRVIGYSSDGGAFTLADGPVACPAPGAAAPGVACTIQLTRN
jgi:hypothetical protein